MPHIENGRYYRFPQGKPARPAFALIPGNGQPFRYS
jgi:hypothetical protein